MLNNVQTREFPPLISDEFVSINRYWDQANNTFSAKILPGEYFVSLAQELITTVLGSCIAVCVRDPVLKIGGMNHFMLPKINSYTGSRNKKLLSAAGRYGNVAMERLINCILQNGGNRFNLEFKIFGGARVLDINTDVGNRNIMFITEYLKHENFLVESHDLGGPHPRKVNYDTDTGTVLMKKLRVVRGSTLQLREQAYSAELEQEPVVSEVTMFTR